MGGRVYFSVFAGRRRFLSVLMVYVRPLLDQKTIDVVHLWDYCRVPSDREYLRTLADASRGIEIVPAPASDAGARFPNKWKGYYSHYAALLGADDFLIKCDDDIVFLANLPVLLNVARRDTEGAHLMYYPSVVNNDVSASFQAADGIITDPEYVLGLRPSRDEGRYSKTPISDWYNCTRCAEHVHTKFLSGPEQFFTGCLHEWSVPCRVPINFFVMRGSAVVTHFGAYAKEQFVDEPYLTALLTERKSLPSLIVSDCVAVHFSFGFQHMVNEKEVLDRYRTLAKDTSLQRRLSDKFGGRTLSTACPKSAPAALLQGKRNLTANDRPPGKGGGKGKGGGRGGKGVGGKGPGGKGGGTASRGGAAGRGGIAGRGGRGSPSSGARKQQQQGHDDGSNAL